LISFSTIEKNQILSWFQYYARDSRHYGNGEALFPSEGMILKKLKLSQEVFFNSYELDLMKEWMFYNIKRKYGNAQYLIGDELALYHKLANGDK